MGNQFFDGSSVSHERTRHPLIPQAVGVPDTVRAVQWAPLDVVQAESALAVLDNLTGALGQALDLIPAQQANTGGHLVLSQVR
jgi:hypothetical protein